MHSRTVILADKKEALLKNELRGGNRPQVKTLSQNKLNHLKSMTYMVGAHAINSSQRKKMNPVDHRPNSGIYCKASHKLQRPRKQSKMCKRPQELTGH